MDDRYCSRSASSAAEFICIICWGVTPLIWQELDIPVTENKSTQSVIWGDDPCDLDPETDHVDYNVAFLEVFRRVLISFDTLSQTQ